MEQYEALEMELIIFETEDIITTSNGDTQTPKISNEFYDDLYLE